MVVGTVPLGRRCSGARLATGISGGDAARSRGPHDGAGFDRRSCITGESTSGGSHGALLRRLEVAALHNETARGGDAAGAGRAAGSGGASLKARSPWPCVARTHAKAKPGGGGAGRVGLGLSWPDGPRRA
jgi:hypothetical protein